MKRLGFVIISFFMCLVLFSQDLAPEIKSVEAPRFSPEKMFMANEDHSQSPICCYLKNNLVYPISTINPEHEGTVVVQFMIDTQGKVDYLTVLNSITPELDESVVECISATSGMWIPGNIDGIPVPMKHKIYVRFDIPDNLSHEVMAREHVAKAMRLYYDGIESSNTKKSHRKLNRAMEHLNEATRYQPEELSIIYWQFLVYNELDDDVNMARMMDDFMNICLKPEMQSVNMAGGQ